MINRVLGLACALVLSGTAQAAPVNIVVPPPVVMPTLAAGASPQQVALARTLVKLNEGQVWAHLGTAFMCNRGASEVRWKADQAELETERFSAVFEEEARLAGFAASKSDDLFNTGTSASRLQVGVIIKDMDALICSIGATADSPAIYRGQLLMTAEWQVFDPAKREIVARVETSAGGEQKRFTVDGVERLRGVSRKL